MSALDLDPGRAQDHADDHRYLADELTGVLGGVVLHANTGIAAEVVTALMRRALVDAQAMADTHTLIGGVVEQIARDATITDEAAVDAFAPIADGLEDA